MFSQQAITHFHRSYIPEPNSGCWLWEKALRNSYPLLEAGGYYGGAHRFSYRLYKGPIPQGMFICHACDVSSCVNPDHLWVGTPKQNTRDAVAKKRFARGERQGHAKLTTANVVEIRGLKGVVSQRKLAARFGVVRTTIQAVLNERTWRADK